MAASSRQAILDSIGAATGSDPKTYTDLPRNYFNVARSRKPAVFI